MHTIATGSKIYEHLRARWSRRKAAAHELLDKYGGNLPHCVVLKVGIVKISMFVEDIIQHTGERFLKEMMAGPASDGIVTISIPEADMPAASLAFNLMGFKQHDVRLKDLLDLMATLHYCNALDMLDAITASFDQSQVFMSDIVEIIQSWIRRMQAKPLSEISFPDQVQGIVISSLTKKFLHHDIPEKVCIIPGHPDLDFSLNLTTVFS